MTVTVPQDVEQQNLNKALKQGAVDLSATLLRKGTQVGSAIKRPDKKYAIAVGDPYIKQNDDGKSVTEYAQFVYLRPVGDQWFTTSMPEEIATSRFNIAGTFSYVQELARVG
jgi:hypothetical protein